MNTDTTSRIGNHESNDLTVATMKNNETAWLYSFAATLMPFVGVCYAHQRGLTVKVLESVARSPVGVYGFFALPFMTLGMEKVRL